MTRFVVAGKVTYCSLLPNWRSLPCVTSVPPSQVPWATFAFQSSKEASDAGLPGSSVEGKDAVFARELIVSEGGIVGGARGQAKAADLGAGVGSGPPGRGGRGRGLPSTWWSRTSWLRRSGRCRHRRVRRWCRWGLLRRPSLRRSPTGHSGGRGRRVLRWPRRAQARASWPQESGLQNAPIMGLFPMSLTPSSVWG